MKKTHFAAADAQMEPNGILHLSGCPLLMQKKTKHQRQPNIPPTNQALKDMSIGINFLLNHILPLLLISNNSENVMRNTMCVKASCTDSAYTFMFESGCCRWSVFVNVMNLGDARERGRRYNRKRRRRRSP
jgi:hypothetical protein